MHSDFFKWFVKVGGTSFWLSHPVRDEAEADMDDKPSQLGISPISDLTQVTD